MTGPGLAERYAELAAAVDQHCPVLDLFQNPVLDLFQNPGPVTRAITAS